MLPGIESRLGLPTTHIAYSNIAMWIVFSYLWLPFMIVPIYGAFERVPDSLLEASSDLGGGTWSTVSTSIRRVKVTRPLDRTNG